MYAECRHVKTNGAKCHAPALRKSHWCYFHDRLHRRQSHPGGRPPRPAASLALLAPGTATLDYGHIPVAPAAGADPSFRLPALEDCGSIQFALNDVLQALAANQLDPKRAGLLLYGLQIASQNSRELSAYHDPVRAVTYAADGSALGPAEQGWDIEDLPDEDDEDEDEDDENNHSLPQAARRSTL